MTDAESRTNSSDATPEPGPSGPKKKRSPIERALVWGLIAVALLVVLIEWNARSGYSKTLAALQERIELSDQQNGAPFPLDEARTMVSGFPLGKEELTDRGKRLQYHWFSLFRTYDLQLTTDDEDIVLGLKTEADPAGDAPPEIAAPQNQKQPNKPPIAAHQLSLPDKGLDRELKDEVVLSTEQLDSQVDELQGILTREVVRQALLIGGRDGLGRKTRDTSLRGDVKLVENPERFPIQLITHINRNREVSIDLILPYKTELPYRWNSEPFTLPEEFAFEALVEQSEALSRDGFVDALKEAGFSGKAAEWKEESSIPEKTAKQIKEWSFISQYTVAQDMHAAIAAEGESPERLALLARAYANLGSPTERLQSPAHKVFKARALLYAERLTNRCEDSPWSLAHRAYVRTLVGRHQSAIADLKTVQSTAKDKDAKRPLPDWLELIEAYCLYQPEVLQKATRDENLQYMAVYLRAMQTDPDLDGQAAGTRSEELLAVEPACVRALDQLNDLESFQHLSKLTEVRQKQIWEQLYKKLQAGNLPAEIKEPLDDHMAFLFKVKTKLPFRNQITRQLKNAIAHDQEPSVNALGQLLQEVSYLQACRRLYFLTEFLSRSADDDIAEVEPLLVDHPYAPYIKIYSSVPADVQETYRKLRASYDPTELELSSAKLITGSYGYLKYEDYAKIKAAAVANLDRIFQDQLQYQRFLVKQKMYSRNLLGDIARLMLEISPHQPQTVSLNIDANQGYADQHHAEIVKKYGDNPEILSAMGKRHLRELNDEKAEEILLRRLEFTKDFQTYESLAELYMRRGEMEKWLDIMKKSLRVPTTGLENAEIRSKIAYYYMGEGKWEEAKPYAMDAAKTYSAWGLICGAHYLEGVGQLDAAEKLMENCSKRYEANAAGWYFWCVRTDFGDREEALELAEEHLLANPTSGNYTQSMERGVLQLTQGLKSEAFDTFQSALQKYNDGYCGLHAALLADELELPAQRDDLLKQIAGMWNKDFGKAELANLFQTLLQNPGKIDWNANRFQSLLVQIQDGSPTNFYYFAGKLLEQHGEEKWANIYLQSAATSSATNKYNCMLAAQHLRSKNIEINDRRTSELDAGYAYARQQLQKASQLLQKGKPQEAIDICNAVLKSKPELVAALMSRGQAHEALKDDKAALADYQRALEIDPDYWLAHNNLTYIYAASEQEEFRDKAKALQHAQRAFDLQPTKFWGNYGAMAVAYAANGQFEKAIEMQNQVLRLGPESQRLETVRRLSLFREGKPYLRSAEK
ncbi:tetratricopeptide repeat protein [Gimesia panareensis]|uniref:tetratricopeptide repeat protein n=1 Tax=Gimesia panareensis TaxID=2527978 RepID=UPI00119EED5B|nr:tetratricopeptide repeat protein [Gimesia panareensis]